MHLMYDTKPNEMIEFTYSKWYLSSTKKNKRTARQNWLALAVNDPTTQKLLEYSRCGVPFFITFTHSERRAGSSSPLSRDGPDLQSKKNAIGRSVFRLRCIELKLLFHDGVTLMSASVQSAYVLF
jgi:hypothetical protein